MLPQVVDGLIAQAKAAEVRTFDGPEVENIDEHCLIYLVIGWTGDDMNEDAFTVTEVREAVESGGWTPHRSRLETGTVRYRISAASGDANAKLVRDQAMTVHGQLQSICRTLSDLGLPQSGPYVIAETGAYQVQQFFTIKGAVCNVTGEINWHTRLDR
jgi:hypothetical protein